jgi:FkbM family methyltransferase
MRAINGKIAIGNVIEATKGLLYYLLRVRGASAKNEMRLLSGLVSFICKVPLLGFGYPLKGPWSTIPGTEILTVRVGNMVFRARPRTMDLSFATQFIDVVEGYELRNWFIPNAKGVVVDVGANVGGYTVRACKTAKKVIAIEPQPDVFNVLRQNVKLNCPNNVVLVRKAVADRPGRAVLRVPVIGGFVDSDRAFIMPKYISLLNAKRRIRAYREVEVELDTLDNILMTLDSVDLLKVDVEGAEALVIKGARHTLERTKRIMIEIRDQNVHVLDELKKAKFKVLDRRGNNYLLIKV